MRHSGLPCTSRELNSPARQRDALLAIGLLVLAALGGCSTYINVPPQGGDVARNDPNLPTVREIEIKALQGMFSEDPIETPYQIILPHGTSAAHYNVLLGQLDDDHAMWSIKGPRDGVAHIIFRQIRVRGWYAQVDIVRPTSFRQADGPRQLATVWLQWYPGTGWTFKRIYLWSIGVEEALREAQRQAELNIQP